jgi:glycerophosphoryl diester phosphodiesterase
MPSAHSLPSLFSSSNDDFITIAHRGASGYYPENTMASFEGAVELESDMIELDVALSKDGVPVVIHDAELKRTTNGRGPVSSYTLQELKKLDAGAWFASSFAGQRIPTLEEALEFAAETIALNIEIKTEAVSDKVTGGVETKCLELVRKYGMLEHVLFSSFNYRAVSRIKEMEPPVPVALVYERWQSGLKSPSRLIAEYNADAFNCSYRQLTKKRLADLKSNDIPVYIYTVNHPAKMEALIKRGVNGIFTNKPDVLREVIDSLNTDGQRGA